MVNRLTFRQWSIAAGLGERGRAILEAHREARRAWRKVREAVFLDTLHGGTGIMHMGEGCTPIFKRIDPRAFYVHPQGRGEGNGT